MKNNNESGNNVAMFQTGNEVATLQSGNNVATSQTGNEVATLQSGNNVATSQTGNEVATLQSGNNVATSQPGNNVATSQPVNEVATLQSGNDIAGFGTLGGFKLIQRVAKLFNSSSMTPEQYRGEKNIGNCIIAVNMANRLGADPLMVMQNLNIIQGKPSWSSSFTIALFNNCGKFAPIRYRATGEKGTDTQGVIAYTYDKETGEIIEGEEVTIGLAKAEGWYNKSGSKWRTMPGQMLRYRAAVWLIRTTAPELTFGLYMQDEVIDVTPV